MTTWPSIVKARTVEVALILAVFAVPAIGRGEQAPPHPQHAASLEGTIDRIDGDLAVVDIGSMDGIERADRVTLFQVVKGKRVAIGETRVVRVADEQCWVGLRHLPKGAVRPGDIVVAEPTGWAEPAEAPAPRPAPIARPTALPPPPPALPPPPSSAATAAVAPAPSAVPPVPRVAHDPVSRITEGAPLQVSLVVVSVPPLAGATLFYRTGRARDFTEIAMERTGDAGWTATIPGAEVRDGSLSYYVRGTDPDGRKVTVFAGPRQPWKVPVESRAAASGGRRAGIIGTFEWQESYLQRPNTDTYWRTELGFEYRVLRGAFHAIRAGFGAVEGVGGETRLVESDAYFQRPHRGVGYAWVEPVFHFGRYVRWTPRVMLGGVGTFAGDRIGTQPSYKRGEVIGGAASLLEFGPEDVFSIGLKGSFLVPIGAELAILTTIQAGHGFQAGLSIGATSFPVHADWAGQVMLMGGWHGLDWLSLDLKVGVNIRSTQHAGLGGGLGLSFWW